MIAFGDIASRLRGSTHSAPSIDNTRVILFAYGGTVTVELMMWLTSRYLAPTHPNNNFVVQNTTGLIEARNTAVKNAILNAPPWVEWVLCLDNDTRPDHRADAIYDLDTDIRCCQVEMKNPLAWSKPTSFHEALYLAHRRVFESIGLPAFEWKLNEQGTAPVECTCQTFARKVLDKGFTISHGGYCKHDQSGSWH